MLPIYLREADARINWTTRHDAPTRDGAEAGADSMGFRFPTMHPKGGEQGGDSFEIIPMRRRHLKAVVAIEQQVFPSPWSLGLYLSELALGSSRAYYVAAVSTER